MNHRPFRFTIYAKLPQRKESPAEIGAKFLNAVDALTRIDHLFADWEVLDLPAMQSLPLRMSGRALRRSLKTMSFVTVTACPSRNRDITASVSHKMLHRAAL